MHDGQAADAQLIADASTDPDAFGALYDMHVEQIYRFIYRRVHAHEIAEDITSDVFFKALKAMPRYRDTGRPFSAWLYQIALNAIADHFRARRPAASLEVLPHLQDGGVSVADEVADKDRVVSIWYEIDALPPQQRTAIALKIGEDQSLAAIAAAMNKSEGAVKLLIHRGMTTLRAKLRPDVPAEEGA